ncbi:hypothetical protein AMECASPLE_004076 [Ameca splendens]|uniref:Uncharacterized protein n=1 Tax=Ameca splendens TaxID=208324 RepID=A0ABV0ZUM7_9TELE
MLENTLPYYTPHPPASLTPAVFFFSFWQNELQCHFMIVSIKKSERGKKREERSLGHRFHSALSYLPCSTLKCIHKPSLPHSRKEVHLGIGCRKNCFKICN